MKTPSSPTYKSMWHNNNRRSLFFLFGWKWNKFGFRHWHYTTKSFMIHLTKVTYTLQANNGKFVMLCNAKISPSFGLFSPFPQWWNFGFLLFGAVSFDSSVDASVQFCMEMTRWRAKGKRKRGRERGKRMDRSSDAKMTWKQDWSDLALLLLLLLLLRGGQSTFWRRKEKSGIAGHLFPHPSCSLPLPSTVYPPKNEEKLLYCMHAQYRNNFGPSIACNDCSRKSNSGPPPPPPPLDSVRWNIWGIRIETGTTGMEGGKGGGGPSDGERGIR